VIFDGEKRSSAYVTYKLIRDKVAVSIFDDSNLGAGGRAFVNELDFNNEVWCVRQRMEIGEREREGGEGGRERERERVARRTPFALAFRPSSNTPLSLSISDLLNIYLVTPLRTATTPV
jgi:hypothetical protein